MIINFKVQNFGPIKEEVCLSFEADSSDHLEDYYVIYAGKFRLLKLALIYGANASGKTTVLKALDFFRTLVVEPVSRKTQRLEFEPFLFDKNTPSQNTKFSIEFLQNNSHYLYEIEISKQCVVLEALYLYPNKAVVFKRTTDTEKQLTKITFGAKVSVHKEVVGVLQANTLWNNSVLGGFLKTNIDQKEIKDAVDWFSDYLSEIITPTTDLNEFVADLIDTLEVDKKVVLDILKRADFNISDIIIKNANNDLYNTALEFLSEMADQNDIIQDGIERIRKPKLDTNFEHLINDSRYQLPFEAESNGTHRYYGFAGILYLSIKKSMGLCIDELETALHPDLFTHFLLSFLINSKRSQIIATTHNREILSNRDIFREDAIWIADKNESSATELYSLVEFDSSVIRDTTNILNAYKSGKLGGIPNLGDYFISVDDE